MKQLDADPEVVTWTKAHRIRIPYSMYGKKRKYIPDFLVTMVGGKRVLEECKGYVFDRVAVKLKMIGAVRWCKLRGIEYRMLGKKEIFG